MNMLKRFKNGRREMCFILSLILIVCSFTPVAGGERIGETALQVQEDVDAAPGVTEVKTYEELRDALSNEGEASIRIVKDISRTENDVDGYVKNATAKESGWIRVGKGNKTLDLNGHTVEIYDKRGDMSSMLYIPTGAFLTINDSDKNNKGKLYSNGSFKDISMWNNYIDKDFQRRDVINVDGGTLTINGGTFEAGRSKEMWVYKGYYIGDWLRNSLILINRICGYAYQQIGGNAVNVNKGTVTINDGVFYGRFIESYDRQVNNDGTRKYDFVPSAAVSILDGKLTINGGEFHGKGNAYTLGISSAKNPEVKVNGGVFKTQHLKKVIVPSDDLYYSLVEWEKGVTGLANGGIVPLSLMNLDFEKQTVEQDGVKLSSASGYKYKDSTVVVINTNESPVRNRDEHSKAYRKPSSAQKQEDIPITAVDIPGTWAVGMEFNSDTLKCETRGVYSIMTKWIRNGYVQNEGAKLVPGYEYQAVSVITAADGYVFTPDTACNIMGEECLKSSAATSAYKTLYVYSRTKSFECDHSADPSKRYVCTNDGSKHYKLCAICGKKYNEEDHSYEKTTDNNKDTYTCSKCGHIRVEDTSEPTAKTVITDVTLSMNLAYIGDDIPFDKINNAGIDTTRFHVEVVGDPHVKVNYVFLYKNDVGVKTPI